MVVLVIYQTLNVETLGVVVGLLQKAPPVRVAVPVLVVKEPLEQREVLRVRVREHEQAQVSGVEKVVKRVRVVRVVRPSSGLRRLSEQRKVSYLT
jgi:hypothetical protein